MKRVMEIEDAREVYRIVTFSEKIPAYSNLPQI